MMWGWGDRAWRVIESVILRSPDKGFWACLGELFPDMPRQPETWVSLCNSMLKLRSISHRSAIPESDSPQSNNSKGNFIHPTWKTSCQLCRLFKATTAYTSACIDADAALAPLLSRETKVRHWQSVRILWPDTRTLQFPWMIAVD